ncbi:MAG: sodium-dependent transporter [Chloroflexi bacterium]|nr:sodium-dependent transporter [Chloroflexota bacterium]
MQENAKPRGSFGTSVGVLAATLGSAIGLGNIWKFPSLTGLNGGAAFVIVYIAATFLVGLPVMISEHALGRNARADAITTFRKLAPKSAWWLVGFAGAVSAFLIMAFYTEVAGWVFAYIVKAIGGGILSTDPAVTSEGFAKLISSPWQSLIWQWIVLIWVAGIILFGVSKGIERMTKRLLPLLLVLLIIIGIRSITLPGGAEGLKFLFKPDFSQITWETVLVAMGLAFFKLSVGMGTMITYGSYFREDQNIPATATRVMLADLIVSMLAGIAIFPAVFAYGFEPASGPSLLFITIPAVFSSMPGGAVFMVLFFILAAVAATGAMLSLFEVPVAYLSERCRMSRTTATILTLVALAVVGSTAALSSSTMADFKIAGKTMFDLFDYATSNVLLPLGGLLICVFVGWRWGWAQVKEELSNRGKLDNARIARLFFGVAKFVTPVLVFVVLLSGLGLIG